MSHDWTLRVGVAMVAVACCLGTAGRAAGQCNEKATHRPIEDLFLSEIVFPQERGETQLEFRPLWQRDPEGRTSAVGLNVEYGLSNAWQIETEWDGLVSTRDPSGATTSGVGDVSIGSKFFLKCIKGSPYHLSVGADVEFPAGTLPEAENGVARMLPAVVFGRDVATMAHLFSSVVVAVPLTHRGDQSWDFVSDSGMFVRVVRGFRATAEVSVSGGPDLRRRVEFVPGCLWHWRDRVEVGAGLLIPVSRDAPHGVLTHVVYEFGGEHDARQ